MRREERYSKAQFCHKLVVRYRRFTLLASCGSGADIALIFQSLNRAIEEVRRNHDSAATNSTRGNLDGLALSGSDKVALPITELG